jgi:hypothetical protein
VSDGIFITPGWWGMLETPAAEGFDASPVFVEEVVPLKTGKRLLKLKFVQAIHPIASSRREVTLQVLFRTEDRLVGELKYLEGMSRTIVLTVVDVDWLHQHCADFIRRHLRIHWLSRDSEPLSPDTLFGRTPEAVLRGLPDYSLEDSPQMPEKSSFSLDQSYDPFDSWMIARGLAPKVMEQRWCIYMKNGRLLFCLSWTGKLIYEVEAVWRGHCLHLGETRVRHCAAPSGFDFDRSLLEELIRGALLGATY